MDIEHKRKIGESNQIALKKFYANGGVPWNKQEPCIKKCIQCGKRFTVRPARINTAKYCSYSCKAKHKPVRLTHGKSHTPEYKRFYCNTRRALKRNADGSHTIEEWTITKRNFNFMCVNCGAGEPEIKLTRDHIIPLSRGGSDYISNIQPLCKKCNSIKSYTITAD